MAQITFTQGEDYQFTLSLLDDTGAPLNLVGFTFVVQLRNVLGEVEAVGSVVSVSTGTGEATFKLANVETIRTCGLMVLQVKVIGSTGNVVYAVNTQALINRNGDIPFRVIETTLFAPLPTVSGLLNP